MKKTLLLMFTLLAVVSVLRAQTFEFQYQGHSLADGATVTIVAEEDMFGELSCETNPAANPANGLVMKLLAGSEVNVNATLEITHNTLSPSRIQWCMGGECTMFGSATKLNKQFTLRSVEQVQMDATDIRATGYLMATLKASVGLEKRQVNIKFTNGEDADALRSVNQGRSKSVSRYRLNGASASSRLPRGIYIVSDGVRTRKVIMK